LASVLRGSARTTRKRDLPTAVHAGCSELSLGWRWPGGSVIYASTHPVCSAPREAILCAAVKQLHRAQAPAEQITFLVVVKTRGTSPRFWVVRDPPRRGQPSLDLLASKARSCACPFGRPRITEVWRHQFHRDRMDNLRKLRASASFSTCKNSLPSAGR
jgi:hypothetical protein